MLLTTGLFILVHITLGSARQPGCDERGPICGNDGKTYKTMCQLIWARLEDSDLAVLHEGSCNGKYFSSIVEPSAPEDMYTHVVASSPISQSSGKKLNRLAIKKKPDKKNYEKIRAIMPPGWPPLGPMLLTPSRPLLNVKEI